MSCLHYLYLIIFIFKAHQHWSLAPRAIFQCTTGFQAVISRYRHCPSPVVICSKEEKNISDSSWFRTKNLRIGIGYTLTTELIPSLNLSPQVALLDLLSRLIYQ